MKIAHVFPSMAWGGAEIYVVLLAQAQQAAGLDVVVWGKPNSPMIEEAKRRGLVTLTEFVPYRLGIRHTKQLARVIREQKITHLHGHWSGAPWSFFRIKRYCAVRLIYQIHLWISVYKGDPVHALAYRQLDAVIVAGERARQAARALLPLREDQLHICPYLMDPTRLPRLQTTRADWGLPEKALILGMFSRLDGQKGVKEFALALNEILPKHPNVCAVLMGDPTRGEASAVRYAEEVEAVLKANPAAERIFRFPFRPDYLEVLKNCDVMVAPSYNESYSLTFLDAFGLGVPVVSTEAGGTPDLVPPSRGWLIEARSVASLSRALDQLCRNPEEIRARSRACKDYVLNEHGPEAVLKKMTRIYSGETIPTLRQRLLVTCMSNAWGGLEMVASELAIEFQRHGYSVMFACYTDSPLDQALRGGSVEYRTLDKNAGLWRKIRWFRKIIEDFQPESVLINRLPTLKAIVPALFGYPQVRLAALSHMLVNYNKKDVFHRILYSRIDRLIVLTEHHKANQLRFLPVAADKMEVIPDWISCKAYEPVEKLDLRSLFAEQWRHLPVSVMASRLDPQKGQDLAIQALGAAKRKGRPFLLVILGESTRGERDLKADLLVMAEREGVLDWVRFLGYQENIFPFVAAADNVLVPSREETFGRVVIEAMHLGTPVVASNRGGPTCILEHMHSGILFDPECANDLEEKIHTLNSDSTLHGRVAHNAREKSKIYSKDVVFEQLSHSVLEAESACRSAILSISGAR